MGQGDKSPSLSIFTQRAASVNGNSTCHCVHAPIALEHDLHKALASCPLLCFVFEKGQQQINESNDQWNPTDVQAKAKQGSLHASQS